MKRIMLIALSIVLLLCAFPTTASADSDVWDGRTSEEFSGGSGTADDPYLIANGAQLYYLSLNCGDTAYKSAYYKITNDIDLGNKRFSPISSFSGTLDGDGHEIDGLKIISSGSTYAGLILSGDGCQIKNLTLNGSVQGASYAGAFVGYLEASTISNCVNNCTVTSSNQAAGGIAGVIHTEYYLSILVTVSPSHFVHCVNNGNISGSEAGGIVGSRVYGDKGYVKNQCTFNDCVNRGTITGKSRVGGIAGMVVCFQMNRCVNVGTINGTLTSTSNGRGYIGGLIGWSRAGDVWNQNMHQTDWYPSSTSDSYNAGSILYNGDYYYAGGIWGDSGSYRNTINRCYNVGVVTASSTYSDISSEKNYVTCNNVYYLSGVNPGATNPDGAVGNSAEDMTLPAGFSGFNFNSVWGWDSDNVYPYPILKSIGVLRKYSATMNNYTDGAAVLSGINNGADYFGNIAFTVSCENSCVVAYSTDGGETYTKLVAEGESGSGSRNFTVNITTETTIFIALLGDVDLNGTVNRMDATKFSRYMAEWEGYTVNNLTADINNDGKITRPDATLLSRYIAEWDDAVSMFTW